MSLDAQIGTTVLTGALRTATTELRMLEPAPSWTYGPYRGVFAAGVHTAAPALGPRRYVAIDPRAATFYSGLPVDPAGTIEAHLAGNLVDRWDELHSFLEGHFVAVRVHREGATAVEVVVDPLGLEQAYVIDAAGGTLLSNSVRVLDHAAGLTGLDPVGLSLLVSVGWVGSDRTLRAGVRCVRGGQYLRWARGGHAPVESSYFSSRQLSTRQSWRLRPAAADQLCDSLVSTVRTLDKQFGDVECALTGGRDSRLLAGLTIAAGATHEYYTAGHPASGDVVVAQGLAKELGLRHRVVPTSDEDVIKDWDESVARLVAVTDGLVSVKELGGPAIHVDQLSVHLHGFGGEIARSFFMGPRDLVKMRLPSAVERLHRHWVKSRGGLVTGNGIELATASVKSFIDRRLDEGIRRDDLADHFYTFDRLPRWGGTTMHRRADQVDYFHPLCSRDFIKTAFSVRALSRYSVSAAREN